MLTTKPLEDPQIIRLNSLCGILSIKASAVAMPVWSDVVQVDFRKRNCKCQFTCSEM
jgi:hypothetical protein